MASREKRHMARVTAELMFWCRGDPKCCNATSASTN